MENSNTNKQIGFSLVELMVASSIALIIISAIMNIYVSSIKNSRNLLSSSSLNQELTAIMDILVNDIRHSGFYSGASKNYLMTNNPFYVIQKTQPETDPPQYFMPYAIHINAKQNCISLSYDADQDTDLKIQNNDVFAFRIKNKAIQTLKYANLVNFSKNACANNAGRWMSITDNHLIHISELKFSTLGSQCYNLGQSTHWKITKDSHLFPCLSSKNTLSAGDRLVETRLVTIHLKANLSSDLKIETQLIQQVRAYNNLVAIIPPQSTP